MSPRRFSELIAWQLADQLRREGYRLTATGMASRDFAFRDDIRAAAASVANNTAEGFARYRPREFHRFLEIAKASLAETENHLDDGQSRGHFTVDDTRLARTLAKRTAVAQSRLMRYLRSSRATENARRGV